MDTGSTLCELCLGRLPEQDRQAVRSERVHAGERHVALIGKPA